ncbi:outer membrane beta-barrel protein [Thalassolituus oleivorans]|uniref:outer membrane beta-barrel protein n=1 Tax=Thalassolituus oleivorans TaxID=187493 RepID=UPI00042DB872|nr:outer membrane beta-barrel protein [Thalassolituus oleivorans]AHK17659.1 hypothetical protein R615_11065 [Thalassolituus oleivorans R6-15]
MKNLVLCAIAAISLPISAHADSSFNYNSVNVKYGYSNLKLWAGNDLDIHTLRITLTKELNNQFFIGGSIAATRIDDSFMDEGIKYAVEANVKDISIQAGRYFIVNKSIDLYTALGYSRTSGYVKVTGTLGSIEESSRDDSSSTSIDWQAGARIFLDQHQKVELSPAIAFSQTDGETDTSVGSSIGYYLKTNLKLAFTYSRAIDDEVNSYGIRGSYYF